MSDLALLTLGELRLKEYAALRAGGAKTEKPEPLAASTNLLQQALSHFDRIINVFTNSEFFGKAHLDRGWCFWAQGRIPESKAAFQIAAERLPVSEDQAVARFKLADAQYEQKDLDRKSTRLNSSHIQKSRMPSSA